jgi:hypothetical protein
MAIKGDEVYGEGLGGWSCCQVDSSSIAISQIHEFERETVAKERGGGHEVDGCTDGAGAADHGLRGGWTDAGGFCGVIKRGEEIWPTWWLSAHFCQGENGKSKCTKRREGESPEPTQEDLNFHQRKI